MKTIIKLLKWVVIFLIALSIWIGLNSIDEDLTDEAKKYLAVDDIADADNGYVDISLIDEAEFKTVSDGCSRSKFEKITLGTELDVEYAQEVLSDKQEALSSLDGLVSKPSFKFPESEDPFSMPSFSKIIDLNKLNIMASILHAKSGEFDKAISVAEKSIIFSQRIKNLENQKLISYLISLRMESDALNWVHTLVLEYDLDNEQLGKISRLFEQIKGYKSDSFSEVIWGEFRYSYDLSNHMFDSIVSMRFDAYEFDENFWNFSLTDYFSERTYKEDLFGLTNALIPSYYTHPNETANMVLDNYKSFAELSAEYCKDINIKNVNIKGRKARWDISWLDIVSPNSAGEIWGQSGFHFSNHFKTNCRSHAYAEGVKTVVALKRFEADKGYLPENLQQLVPEYLNTLPIDPFDGNPLRYSKKDLWVYSVGVNYLDDGGDAEGQYSFSCNEEDKCFMNPTVKI